jgi:hypothetical protein
MLCPLEKDEPDAAGRRVNQADHPAVDMSRIAGSGPRCAS